MKKNRSGEWVFNSLGLPLDIMNDCPLAFDQPVLSFQFIEAGEFGHKKLGLDYSVVLTNINNKQRSPRYTRDDT